MLDLKRAQCKELRLGIHRISFRKNCFSRRKEKFTEKSLTHDRLQDFFFVLVTVTQSWVN